MSKRFIGATRLLVLVWLALSPAPMTYALDPQSTHFRFDESSIGTGGLLESNSANYKATNAVGDLGIGNSKSTNFQIDSGLKTSPDPALSFSVNTANVNFGNFSASTPSMTTATFSVLNYTSYGYAVFITGGTPTDAYGHSIPPTSTPYTSSAGFEQFGINLVANTSPQSIGANPDQGQFGFGVAAANYNTPNEYRFNSGDMIASAPKSSGVTNFTMSYLVNVAALTPGGTYTTNQTLIVTGTY